MAVATRGGRGDSSFCSLFSFQIFISVTFSLFLPTRTRCGRRRVNVKRRRGQSHHVRSEKRNHGKKRKGSGSQIWKKKTMSRVKLYLMAVPSTSTSTSTGRR